MKKITIIDYGMGNLHSVCGALTHEGIAYEVTSELSTIQQAEALLLPGVGAFPDAMKMLNETGLSEVIRDKCARGTPLLGICLGMQLLADSSDEVTFTEGLGLIHGVCQRIVAPGLKIPHMGWNDLTFDQPDCPLLQGLASGTYMYFVHSYRFHPENATESLAAHTLYGEAIPALITNGKNVFGAQFHPEKSQEAGLMLLKNYYQTL